jgi:hypothetical protein
MAEYTDYQLMRQQQQEAQRKQQEYADAIQGSFEAPFAKTQEQKDFLNFLSGQVYNEQPSAGGSFFQQSQNQNLSNLSGAMGSARGVNNPALAASRLAQVAGNIGQQGVSDTSAFKLKEDGTNLARQNLLASTLATQNAGGKDLATMRANIAMGKQSNDLQASLNEQERLQRANDAATNRQMQLIGGIGQMAVTLGTSGAMNKADSAKGTNNKSLNVAGDKFENNNSTSQNQTSITPNGLIYDPSKQGVQYSSTGMPLDPNLDRPNMNAQGLPADLYGKFGENFYPNQDIYEQAFQTSPEQKQYLDYISLNAAKNSGQQASADSLANTAKNIQGIKGTLGSTRGVMNPALLSRQAQNVGANLSQQGINQADIARSQAGGVDVEKQRLAAASLASQNAGEQDLARLRANMMVADRNAQSAQNQSVLDRMSAEDQAAANQQMQNYSTMASIATTAAVAASDINVKENIEPGSEETKNFLDLQYRKMMNELEPYSYDYKNEKYGSGPQLGVMAQDLEKSPAGKQMVGQAKDGTKQIVPNVSTILGAQANLNERLNKLEGQGMNEQPQGYLDFLASQQNQPMQAIQQGPNAIQFPPIDLVGTVPAQATPAPAINQAPRMQKIVPSPMEAPSKIPSSPLNVNKIKSVPGQAPSKIPSTPIKANKIDPSVQKLNKIQSMVEEQNRMQYLDFLMKRYNETANAFTKKYV